MGQVIGHAGGSLAKAKDWLGDTGTAKVGQSGEYATARALDPIARADGGPTVLHDLRIPIPGVKANIDHIVVSGRQVTILDSKTWKPGFYWTLFGATRRGMERFPPADKQTLPMAAKAISAHLSKSGIRYQMVRPELVVWPSSKRGTLTLTLLAAPGANAVTGARFTAVAPHRYIRPADAAIVAALAQLCIRS